MQTGVELDLDRYVRTGGFGELCQLRQQTEPPGSEREMRLHRLRQRVRQGVAQNQNILAYAERAQRQTLGHVRESKRADAGQRGKRGRGERKTQPIGVALQDRDDLCAGRERLFNGGDVRAQRVRVDRQIGIIQAASIIIHDKIPKIFIIRPNICIFNLPGGTGKRAERCILYCINPFYARTKSGYKHFHQKDAEKPTRNRIKNH